MIIYPAIDLIDGACVRLSQGDFNQKTTYSDDPVAMAQSFADTGASWLHLVDLSGAKDPAARQFSLIEKIAKTVPINIQSGGGLRSKAEVAELLKIGVKRVVIGSMAIKNQEMVSEIFQDFGAEKIALALDVRQADGSYIVATSGWQEQSALSLKDVIRYYLPNDLQHVLCTDIGRDGMLSGPNINLYQSLRHEFPDLNIQASGGVSSLADLEQLKQLGVAGAVVGKALYENKFTLTQALAC